MSKCVKCGAETVNGVCPFCGTIVEEKKVDTSEYHTKDDVNALITRIELFIEEEIWDKADKYCERALDADPKNGKVYAYKLLIDLKITSFDKLKERKSTFEENKNNQYVLRFGDDDLKNKFREINAAITDNKYGEKYETACNKLEERDYDAAISLFATLDGYKDSEKKINECEQSKKDEKYNIANDYLEKGNYEAAKLIFEDIREYKDANSKIEECKNLKRRQSYTDGIRQYENGEFEKAIFSLKASDNYGDATKIIEKCNEAIKERDYLKACNAMSEGSPQNAKALFQMVGDYKDAIQKMEECQRAIEENNNEKSYNDAMALGKNDTIAGYEGAIKLLQNILEYRDASDKLNEFKIKKTQMEDAEKPSIDGELVEFNNGKITFGQMSIDYDNVSDVTLIVEKNEFTFTFENETYTICCDSKYTSEVIKNLMDIVRIHGKLEDGDRHKRTNIYWYDQRNRDDIIQATREKAAQAQIKEKDKKTNDSSSSVGCTVVAVIIILLLFFGLGGCISACESIDEIDYDDPAIYDWGDGYYYDRGSDSVERTLW